jgi:6-phosphogluconolactonase (cycloisomerase 2 family)
MLRKATSLVVVCLALAGLISCGSTSSHFVYVALPTTNSGSIAAFREAGSSGVLTAVPGSPFTGGQGTHGIAIHPSNKFLYVTNSNENSVSLFTIASDGSLTEVTPRTTIGVGAGPNLVLVDSTGSFLYVANSLAGNISVFSISSSNGALTAVGTPVAVGATPLAMTFSPSGNLLFITSGTNQGLISIFNVSSGVLSAASSPVPINQSDPDALVVDSTGGFLYTANFQSGTISIFSITTNGTSTQLTQQVNSPLAINFTSPSALLIDQLGPFLYIADSSNIAGYSLTTAGAPTLLTSSPFTATAANLLAQDPSGKVIFVVSSTAITSYTIGSSPVPGTLTSLRSVTPGSSPASIAVSN